jgi:hypothetical protein
MSQKDSNGRGRRAAFTLATAIGGAAAAAMLGMGTANADVIDADGYSDLFGATGTVGYPTAAGLDNASLDTQLFDQNPGQALAFDQFVGTFESNNDHPIADLIYSLDHSAFLLQSDPDIIGTASATGQYLVPDDSLGYLATELDAFLLNPTGLGFLLSPVIEVLLGSPPF